MTEIDLIVTEYMVAQQNDKHLTIEQLSAYLDKQLSAEEEAVFRTHLRRCERCQGMLVDLRQTVGILHALPQVEVPRSFVLPAGITPAQERLVRPVQAVQPVANVVPISRGRGKALSTLRRTVRVMGTIAAAIGIFLLLSSVITGLPHPGAGGASSSTSSGTLAPHSAEQTHGAPGSTPPSQNKHTPSTSKVVPNGTPKANTLTPTLQPGPTPTAQPGKSVQPPAPILDLTTSAGRAGIGAILLVIGILGFLVTRRRWGQSQAP